VMIEPAGITIPVEAAEALKAKLVEY